MYSVEYSILEVVQSSPVIVYSYCIDISSLIMYIVMYAVYHLIPLWSISPYPSMTQLARLLYSLYTGMME